MKLKLSIKKQSMFHLKKSTATTSFVTSGYRFFIGTFDFYVDEKQTIKDLKRLRQIIRLTIRIHKLSDEKELLNSARNEEWRNLFK